MILQTSDILTSNANQYFNPVCYQELREGRTASFDATWVDVIFEWSYTYSIRWCEICHQVSELHLKKQTSNYWMILTPGENPCICAIMQQFIEGNGVFPIKGLQKQPEFGRRLKSSPVAKLYPGHRVDVRWGPLQGQPASPAWSHWGSITPLC